MRRAGTCDDARGISPLIGVVLLVALAIGIAGVAAGGLLAADPPEPRPTVIIEAEVEPATDTISVRHVRGDALDPAALSLQVTVDGTELDEQPPVPFFSADGFAPGPTGPFNAATDTKWTAGETGTLRIASTNDPGGIDSGDQVALTLVYDEHVLAETTITAG